MQSERLVTRLIHVLKDGLWKLIFLARRSRGAARPSLYTVQPCCMHLTTESLGGSDQLNQRAIESKAIGGSQLYNRERKGERPICSEYLSTKAKIGHFTHKGSSTPV